MPRALRFRSRPSAADALAALNLLADGELLALARDNDTDAFAVIYDRHATAAYSLAHRICGTRALAEDVVQEAFLALWRRLDRYDAARGEVRSWLLGIVHNAAIDKLRQSVVHERRRQAAKVSRSAWSHRSEPTWRCSSTSRQTKSRLRFVRYRPNSVV